MPVATTLGATDAPTPSTSPASRHAAEADGTRGERHRSQVDPSQLLVRHTRTHTIDGPSDDVDALLAAAAAKVGVPRDAAWLSYEGRVLRSGRSLRSYGLAAGATVHLAVRGRGGAPRFSMHGASASRQVAGQVSARADSHRPVAVLSRTAPVQPSPAPLLHDQLTRVLTTLDDRVVEALMVPERSGLVAIRLVRTPWLLDQTRILRRQDLEELESRGHTPLLRPEEAAALVRKGGRRVGVLSYGWVSPGDPDPTGHRLEAVKRALRECAHLEAVFWDYASLYQSPRTQQQDEAFARSLKVMGDLYASALATTVLQLREVPSRPASWDGAVCLFSLAEGVDEAGVKHRLKTFGTIEACEKRDWPPVVVTFATRDAARDAVQAAARLADVAGGIDYLFNDRPYHKRGWWGATALLHTAHFSCPSPP